MPPANARGNYPAREAMRVLLARKIIRQRRARSLSQPELAKLAGLSAETLRDIEQAKRSATAAEIKKIDRAFAKAGAKD
ncbi:MAG TPA: helix-turn-helix transcriptional regulator [Pirellulales bacterium]|nr:helix-turn-helix transcriptional regulator [Pirellulales bacterium]